MSQSGPTLTQRGEATRCRILDVAENLFKTFGYQKTAVADIARMLGMSPANLYRFFASKSAINQAIASRTLAGFATELEAIATGAGSAEARLRRFLSANFELCIALFFSERRMHDMVTAAMSEHWPVIEDFLKRKHDALARIVADGIRQGEFGPVEPFATAAHIINATTCWTHPHMIETCLSQRGSSVPELRAEVVAMTDFLLTALTIARTP